ncbi:MAG TPA: diguanylate cyclase [Burkholderiales bacterium]|nr:diguanylate cyclase [Burkholderiales bacterium]
MKVLIAEDEEVGLFMLESALTKAGYEVVAARDGREAWEILQRHDTPQLAIIDWMMPGMDGIELCRRVREARTGPYIYILMLTGKARKEDIVAGMQAGADDYIPKPFDADELRVRVRAGERIVVLQEALRVQATQDALTGAMNRGAIFDVLKRELAQSARTQAPVGVVIADLDHFKQINDTHGHPAGDAVLREAAARLKSVLRAYDALGRYGGEEFVLVLPSCNAQQAFEVAERARRAIANTPAITASGAVPITASFGVAGGGPAALDVDALVRAADDALYRAKRGGRNRVEIAGD